MSTPDERFFTTRGGLRLFYRDYRSNEQRTPVICLPGVLSTSRFFEPVARHMARSHRVLCLDPQCWARCLNQRKHIASGGACPARLEPVKLLANQQRAEAGEMAFYPSLARDCAVAPWHVRERLRYGGGR